MVVWIQSNPLISKTLRELVVWMPNQDLLSSRLNHLIPESTLPKRDAIVQVIESLVNSRWSARNIRETPHLPIIQELLLEQVRLPIEDALASDSSRMPQPLLSSCGQKIMYQGRHCGTIENKKYISKRNCDHFCKNYHGWGIQQVIIDKLKREGVTEIEIWYQSDNGRRIIYSITLQRFLEWARPDCLNEADGDQLFVNEAKWEMKPSPRKPLSNGLTPS
jgi:hypothetical protein